MKLEEEEMLLFKEEKILEEESRLRLEEEARLMHEDEKLLEDEKFFEKDFKKREFALINLDHMKQAMARVVHKKRSYCTGLTSSSWLKVSSKFKDKSQGCYLSRCNTSIDNVWLSKDLDMYLGQLGLLRCRFPWCNDRMVGQKFWESLVCLDPLSKGWLLDDVLIPLNEPGEHWSLAKFDICSGLVTFYDSGDTYSIECGDWYIRIRDCLQTWKSIIDSTDFVVSYGARPSQPASFLVTYD
ncbi:phospholipase-like protein [Tanacetum coccineum]